MNTKPIEIDIDVHKAIEGRRVSFGESHNAILRRILGISVSPKSKDPAFPDQDKTQNRGLMSRGTLIPNGTRLRKILKGRLHEAEVQNEAIVYRGKPFLSPSKAAHEVTGNNVNGWIFWEFFDERFGRWRQLDALRRNR